MLEKLIREQSGFWGRGVMGSVCETDDGGADDGTDNGNADDD